MRKEVVVVISAEGRDKGKTFLLTEMPASQGERWAMRALLALARSGVEVPDDISNAGMAGIAALGLKAFMAVRFDEIEPLLVEMMECIQSLPDPANRDIRRRLVETDIEEIATRLKLRAEVLSLHTGFSLPAVHSTSQTTGPR
jgi:hypothetical protein